MQNQKFGSSLMLIKLLTIEQTIDNLDHHLAELPDLFRELDQDKKINLPGLAIVKKSVEAHGGKITFDSQVNVGTTFNVVIPF